MEQRPDQPPEGKLIAAAAERMDLSIREAARRAGISYGRWRQITSGYQNVSPGNFAAVHAPARTLAKMARVVGVTPEQMEAEGQRPDAAELMRSDQAASAPVQQPRKIPTGIPVIDQAASDEELEPFVRQIRRQIADAVAEYGPGVSGEIIFGSGHEADAWNAKMIPPDATVKMLALFRLFAARNVGGQAGSKTGLSRLRLLVGSP